MYLYHYCSPQVYFVYYCCESLVLPHFRSMPISDYFVLQIICQYFKLMLIIKNMKHNLQNGKQLTSTKLLNNLTLIYQCYNFENILIPRVHNIYREESIRLPIRLSNTLRKVMTQWAIDTCMCRLKMSSLSIKQFTCLMHLASINTLVLLVNTREVLTKYREIL